MFVRCGIVDDIQLTDDDDGTMVTTKLRGLKSNFTERHETPKAIQKNTRFADAYIVRYIFASILIFVVVKHRLKV